MTSRSLVPFYRAHQHDNKDVPTDKLPLKRPPEAAPERNTDPLDLDPPRKLKFIVKESNDVFEVSVHLYMVVGRKTNPRDRKVDIDLTPFANREHGVSRYHSIIQVVDNRISITDFNSMNGTYINGKILQPNKPYRLRHGDNLRFGRLEIKVLFVGITDHE